MIPCTAENGACELPGPTPSSFERLTSTEEEGMTGLVLKTSFGDHAVFCVGRVHIAFKYGVVVVVP